FVGFLGTCVGVLAASLSLIGHWPEGANTKIYTDEHLRIVRLDEKRFEFQLTLTLMNEGQKPDTIRRPLVVFKSDKPIIKYSPNAVFTAKQEEVAFPIILQKDTPVQLVCTITWNPSEDYDRWTSEEPEGIEEPRPALMGRIELTWPGENQRRIERPFALLAAETIRELKPNVPLSIDYLYFDNNAPGVGDAGTRDAAPSSSLFSPQGGECRAAAIKMGGPAHLASVGMWLIPARDAKTHYAVKGEVASGKEVPSAIPGEVIVNIRPCGGGDEMVVFRAEFKKRLLGGLPCGGRMVQVEKL
ncbi:MAG TPA: hypothetical protein VNI02_22895, partial [Blastocatellia bacterium]|nr:hypothetical protein [Blastocatellia bacterium]